MRTRVVIVVTAALLFVISTSARTIPGNRNVRIESGTVNLSSVPAETRTAEQWLEQWENEGPEHHQTPVFDVPAAVRTQRSQRVTPRSPGAFASFNSQNSPAPSLSFLALDMRLGYIPPDTNGAVSASHLVVPLNTQISIQDRQGHELSNVSLMSFWQARWPDLTNVWDANIRYDPYANRWMMACIGNYLSPTSSLLLAVSATADPTGTWYLRRIYEDPNGLNSFDYPRIGFNKNWIVVTGNIYVNATGRWTFSELYVFDKADAYANGTKAPVKFSNITDGFTLSPATTYDPNLDTMYLLGSYNGNSGGSGYLDLSTITGGVGTEQFNLNLAYSSTANAWQDYVPSPSNFAPQLGSTQKVDVFDSRMQSVVYRNGSLWATHMVFVPAGAPTRTAVDWWQLTPAGEVVQFGRIEDPAGTYFYAYPSLSVNKNNDVLIGYSRMASSEYPSAGYTFRSSTDPAGTVRNEYVIKAGMGPYSLVYNSRNRWGDYSGTVVDPVNDVDFWTIQEYANTNNQWSTWWGKISPPAATVTPSDPRHRPTTPPRKREKSPSGPAAGTRTSTTAKGARVAASE